MIKDNLIITDLSTVLTSVHVNPRYEGLKAVGYLANFIINGVYVVFEPFEFIDDGELCTDHARYATLNTDDICISDFDKVVGVDGFTQELKNTILGYFSVFTRGETKFLTEAFGEFILMDYDMCIRILEDYGYNKQSLRTLNIT